MLSTTVADGSGGAGLENAILKPTLVHHVHAQYTVMPLTIVHNNTAQNTRVSETLQSPVLTSHGTPFPGPLISALVCSLPYSFRSIQIIAYFSVSAGLARPLCLFFAFPSFPAWLDVDGPNESSLTTP